MTISTLVNARVFETQSAHGRETDFAMQCFRYIIYFGLHCKLYKSKKKKLRSKKEPLGSKEHTEQAYLVFLFLLH